MPVNVTLSAEQIAEKLDAVFDGRHTVARVLPSGSIRRNVGVPNFAESSKPCGSLRSKSRAGTLRP